MKKSTIKEHIIVIIYFIICLFLLVVKLPVYVSDNKMTHILFCFITAMFLNAIYDVKSFRIHLFIFVGLFFFGVGIEMLQEYSNTFLHKRINDIFDIKNIKSNTIGLICFSVMWIFYHLLKRK